MSELHAAMGLAVLPHMNEIIEKLSELADDMADELIQMPGEYHPDWHTVRDRFFAELIVKECIKIIDAEEPGYQDYRSQIEVMMRNDCAKALEYKFGLPINERF